MRAEPLTVGLVGLGVIGRVHLDVLTADPRFELAFVAEPEREARVGRTSDPGFPHFDDLAEAMQAVERGRLSAPDLVVVATPTATHLDLASHVLDRTTSMVLSEKPLTADTQRLRAFEVRHPDASTRVHVVNHFAFSPEVDWAAQLVAERGWGPPSEVLSAFNDAYAMKSAAERSTYVSSWTDSGPNQLGLLARFVSGCLTRSLVESPDGTRAVAEISYAGGTGILSSNWLTGDSSKQTSLRWPGGRELFLDHTAMTVVAVDAHRAVAQFGHDGTVDRKTAHYAAMYDAYLSDRHAPMFSLDFARSTAELLHRAMASTPSEGSFTWASPQRPLSGPRASTDDDPDRSTR